MAATTTLTPANSRTANLIVIELANQRVGLLQNMRVSNNYGLDPQAGVGDVHVQEYVVTRAQHTITVQKTLLIAESLESLGITPQNGDQALAQAYFSIVVYGKDPTTGALSNVLWQADFCKLDSAEVDIQGNRVVVQNATFMALDVTGDWTSTNTVA